MSLIIPPTSLQEEAVNVAAEFRFLFDVSRPWETIEDAEFIVELIDCYSFLSCEILENASHEGLREEKSAHPEYFRCAMIYPLLQEFDSSYEIFDPATQRLQT